MTRTRAHPGEVRELLVDLRAHEVELPAELLAAGEQLSRIGDLVPASGIPDDTLLGRDDAYLARLIHDQVTAAVIRESAASHVTDVAGALAADIADALAAMADDVIDQLRPEFDQAAAVMHRATELGINTVTTHADVLAMDVQARNHEAGDAWAAVSAAARALESLGSLRLRLSMVAGAPPVPRRSMHTPVPEAPVARSLFADEPMEWLVPAEDVWQKWLRLNTGTQARLVSTAESIAVYKRAQ